ncbi:NAD(P)/FAD-dependent oxidoreductase [Methylomarinovum caldicuralii]|uniref:NAD(P)/FAD-dependent oxidoreductase n=1 Tax=Methylomarinovum caldicuralii TaxID=438856 RepID=UPI002955A1CC|nr:tryptophan 7-halogenase [Methylomarinovum caldicuralii]
MLKNQLKLFQGVGFCHIAQRIILGRRLGDLVEKELVGLGQFRTEALVDDVDQPGLDTYDADKVFAFRFADNPPGTPKYAYNVVRARFNAVLLENARRAGARLIERRVRLTRLDGGDRVRLDEDSLQAASDCWEGEGPDLIVDATGRANLVGRALDIPMQPGPRRDVALFAHVDETELVDPGYVHNDRIDRGWCWRIPLPGRVSLGLVVPREYADGHGDSPDAQYDRLLRADPVLRRLAPKARRLTPVLRFDNYQSLSSRLVGENWVMLGDSAGFVDPVFSSGLLVAMKGAYQLAQALGEGVPLARYEQAVKAHLRAWFEIVGYYYDGRLMTSIERGREMADGLAGRLLLPWVSRRIAAIVIGAATTDRFNLGLLRFLVDARFGLYGRDPGKYRIH